MLTLEERLKVDKFAQEMFQKGVEYLGLKANPKTQPHLVFVRRRTKAEEAEYQAFRETVKTLDPRGPISQLGQKEAKRYVKLFRLLSPTVGAEHIDSVIRMSIDFDLPTALSYASHEVSHLLRWVPHIFETHFEHEREETLRKRGNSVIFQASIEVLEFFGEMGDLLVSQLGLNERYKEYIPIPRTFPMEDIRSAHSLFKQGVLEPYQVVLNRFKTAVHAANIRVKKGEDSPLNIPEGDEFRDLGRRIMGGWHYLTLVQDFSPFYTAGLVDCLSEMGEVLRYEEEFLKKNATAYSAAKRRVYSALVAAYERAGAGPSEKHIITSMSRIVIQEQNERIRDDLPRLFSLSAPKVYDEYLAPYYSEIAAMRQENPIDPKELGPQLLGQKDLPKDLRERICS